MTCSILKSSQFGICNYQQKLTHNISWLSGLSSGLQHRLREFDSRRNVQTTIQLGFVPAFFIGGFKMKEYWVLDYFYNKFSKREIKKDEIKKVKAENRFYVLGTLEVASENKMVLINSRILHTKKILKNMGDLKERKRIETNLSIFLLKYKKRF